MSDSPEQGRAVDPDSLPIPSDTPHRAADKIGGPMPRHPLPPFKNEIPDRPDLEPTEEQKQRAATQAAKAAEFIREGNLGEAVHYLTEGANPDQEKAVVAAVEFIGEKTELTPEEEMNLSDLFKHANMKQEQVDHVIGGTSLSDESKHKIKQKLFPMTEQEKAENQIEVEPDEKTQKIETLKALGGIAEGEVSASVKKAAAEAAEAEVAAQAFKEAGQPEKATAKEKEAEEKHKKHSALQHKLEHLKKWLNPEDGAKEWAARTGKFLWVSALAFLVSLLWYMNLINKAASRK